MSNCHRKRTAGTLPRRRVLLSHGSFSEELVEQPAGFGSKAPAVAIQVPLDALLLAVYSSISQCRENNFDV